MAKAQTIRGLRRSLTNRIIKLVTPHMWDSGYVYREPGVMIGGPSRPLKLWTAASGAGVVMHGYYLTNFQGISECGIMTDATGGGLVSEPYTNFPVEDLSMLVKWLEKKFNA